MELFNEGAEIERIPWQDESYCSICAEDNPKFKTKSSTCEHTYCCGCILSYRKEKKEKPLLCPTCLEEIQELTICFTRQEMEDNITSKYIEEINYYNKTFTRFKRPIKYPATNKYEPSQFVSSSKVNDPIMKHVRLQIC